MPHPKKYPILFSLILLCFSFVSRAQDNFIDSLKACLKAAKDDTTKCYFLHHLTENADENEWPGFNASMLSICDKNLSHLKPGHPLYTVFERYRGHGLNNNAVIEQNNGHYEKALVYLEQAFVLLDKNGDKSTAAIVTSNMGAIYQRMNNYIKALEVYRKAEKLHEASEHWVGVTFCINQIGDIIGSQGDVATALTYYERSLKIAEKMQDKASIANTLYTLAFNYMNLNEIEKAREFALRCLKLNEELKDKGHLSSSYDQIGRLCRIDGKLSEALDYYKKSLKLRQELGDLRSLGMSYSSIGGLLLQMDDVNGASEYFQKNLEVARATSDQMALGYCYGNLGEIAIRQGQTAKALEYYKEELRIGRELVRPTLTIDAALKLEGLYRKAGDYKKAWEFYHTFIAARDSVNSEKNKKAIIRSQFSIEYAKKEQDLKNEQEKKELLHQQEKIRKQADLEKQKAITYSSLGGVILLLALVSLVFVNLKQSKAKNKIITEQKQAVETQKELIEEKQKEIVDSINYARRIQNTLLAHDEFLKKNISDHFIFFKPKAIVSGDFYWATSKNDSFYLAVCDSTGHGVPGAFMSLLNISLLNEAINERNIEEPHHIFEHVRHRLIENMSREDHKDGFDGILLRFNRNTKQITYAAANNHPVIVSGKELQELPFDKMPVGVGVKQDNFQLYTINTAPDSVIYLYTDGFADQFGGPKGKKYKYKQLNDLILSGSSLSLTAQKDALNNSFEEWRGHLEQIDDVCVAGIRFV